MSDRRADPVDLWRDMADAVAGGVRRGLDLQRSLADDYQRRFSDEPRARRVDDDAGGWSALRSDVTDYGTTLFELTLDYYRDVADVATRFVEQVYPRVFEGSRVTTAYGPAGRRPQRATIEVSGTVGEAIEVGFSIENSDDEDAEVLIDADLCRRPDGEVFRPAVTLSPDALVLAPHSSETIVARVELSPDVFEAGGRYRLPISVHGPSPAIIELSITVEEGDASDEPRSGEDDTSGYEVRCPACHRTFERTTPSLKLRPHNDDEGAPCAERDGTRVR